MGKQSKKQLANKRANERANERAKEQEGVKGGRRQEAYHPLVSICTPTHNRRPFLSWLLKCIVAQTYPLDRLEWIILDDGTDCVSDLFTEEQQAMIPFPVHYVYQQQRQTIGQKRNAMHQWCNGDIIVCMDDDDYYPPDRVQHAVTQLMLNPGIELAGCSEMHMYLHNDQKVYQSGPYTDKHANHGTAATFAYRNTLLAKTAYGETSEFSEEKAFCKDYSIPMIQLNTLKTIIVINHTQNTIDKSQFVKIAARVRPSPYPIEHLISDPVMRQFYCHDVLPLLSAYPFERPKEVQVAAQTVYDNMTAKIQQEQNKQERDKQEREQKERNKQERDNQRLEKERMYSWEEVNAIKSEYDKKIEDKNIIISQLLARLHAEKK